MQGEPDVTTGVVCGVAPGFVHYGNDKAPILSGRGPALSAPDCSTPSTLSGSSIALSASLFQG